VKHPAAYASLSVDIPSPIGIIRITVAGEERELIGASYNGVSFYVEKADSEIGRRLVKHEFPYQDKPFVDDLGRKADVWKIDGYVLGPDYDLQKAKLRAELRDKPGPGTLIHPYYGELIVACENATFTDLKEKQGFGQVSITFVETDVEPPAPLLVISLPSLLGALLAAIALVIAGIAAIALTVALTALAVRALVRSCLAFIDSVAGLVDLLSGDDAAFFARAMDRMVIDVEIYVEDPEAFFDDLGAALDHAANADPLAIGEALLDCYATDPGPAPTRNVDYFNAFNAAVRQFLLLKAIGFLANAPFDSNADATAMRAELSDLLDEQAALANEDVYAAFVGVRRDLVQQMPAAGNQLADVVEYTPRVMVPSLLLAYQLYGAVDLEADIVARNHLTHPGWIPGGVAIEVKSRG
jgi:prophage DNA circulation protein